MTSGEVCLLAIIWWHDSNKHRQNKKQDKPVSTGKLVCKSESGGIPVKIESDAGLNNEKFILLKNKTAFFE